MDEYCKKGNMLGCLVVFPGGTGEKSPTVITSQLPSAFEWKARELPTWMVSNSFIISGGKHYICC